MPPISVDLLLKKKKSRSEALDLMRGNALMLCLRFNLFLNG